MLKLKLQHPDHLMQRTVSLEKILMLGKTWSKLREMVKDGGAWHAADGASKSQTQLSD